MQLRGPSCSFAQQVARTAEKPDLWREGCIPSPLGTAASPPTSCVPASLQLRPVPAEEPEMSCFVLGTPMAQAAGSGSPCAFAQGEI